jgi:hypothetical protein
MDESNIGATFINSRDIIKDITECDYEEMYLLVTKFENYFLVSEKDFEAAKEKHDKLHIVNFEEYKNGISGIVRDVKRKYNIKRIGFEDDVVTVKFFEVLKRKLNIKFAGVQMVAMSDTLKKYM